MRELSTILKAAVPIMAGQVGLMLLNTVDVIMVGQWDSGAIASLSMAATWSYCIIVLGQGAAVGLDPVLSQARGAGDTSAADRALARGMAMLALLSVPISIGHLITGDVLRWFGQPEPSLALAHAYGLSLAPSVLPFIWFQALRQALQSRGVSSPIVPVAVVGNVLNIGLNQALMFGVGDWQGMGPVGSGVATSIVRWAMLFALLPYARPELAAIYRHRDQWGKIGPQLSLLAICLPVGVQIGTEVWAFNLGAMFAGWYGEPAAAAHAVALNMAAFSFMFPLAIGQATGTRVGHLLGAEAAWRDAAHAGVTLGVAWGMGAALLLAALPSTLTAIYLTQDDLAWGVTMSLLPYAAAFQVFDGMQVVLFGALRGAGDTRWPTAANLVGYWVIGLPMGVWLAERGMGVAGIWAGFVVALAIVWVLLMFRLRMVIDLGGFRVQASEAEPQTAG